MIGLNFENNVQMRRFASFLVDIGYTDSRRVRNRMLAKHMRIDPVIFDIAACQAGDPYTSRGRCSKVFNITLARINVPLDYTDIEL